ncbi:helicase domino [Trichonephila clavipes]|nr:helicase domino [Trichonephila clavipes]
MITNFFIPELNNHDVQELWFQQDGATCHTARATIDLLKDTFGDRLISRFGPVNWPPRSCDLTPLDYFLWGLWRWLRISFVGWQHEAHRAYMVDEFLESEVFRQMDCPARSQDLVRIEQWSSNCVPRNPGIPQGITNDSTRHNKKIMKK